MMITLLRNLKKRLPYCKDMDIFSYLCSHESTYHKLKKEISL